MNETRGLWRGKDVAFGEWVEGDLVCDKFFDGSMNYCIFERDFDNSKSYTIDPSTLGECTGLSDKNGKLIFEGDILGFDGASGNYDLVEYHNGVFGVRIKPEGGDENYSCCEFPLWEELSTCVPAEVIGNIHDNPELCLGHCLEDLTTGGTYGQNQEANSGSKENA